MYNSARKKWNWTNHITPITVVLLLGTVGVWFAMVLQAQTMGTMPGTMGMSLAAFGVMWGLMMAAMMLPSVAPLASRYVQMIDTHKWVGLITFVTGYFVVWIATGVIAYVLAWFSGKLANDFPTLAMAVAVVTYAVCGFYQFSPLKDQCLAKCRAPFSLLLEYASWRGQSRHFRVGVHHGIFCLGCCWAFMVLMIIFGVMNIGAMLVLTIVITVEKLWVTNQTFSRIVGFICFALAIAVIWFPQLAPGLITNSNMAM